MISAVAILMLCNGIRISLKSKKYNQRNRVCHGVHDTPFSFLHFFVSSFFSSDFTDESEAFLLIGLLTDFRGTLAAGQWLAPDICSCCFCHADFADDADFSSWGLFCPTDFTDIHRFFFVWIILSHRFHRYTQIFLCGDYFVPQISQMTQIFLCVDYFVPQIFLCGTFSNLRGYLHRPARSPP